MKPIIKSIKVIILTIFCFLFAGTFIFAQNNYDLSKKQITYLHKNKINSPRVLVGVANIRYKSSDAPIIQQFSILKPNNDYKILDSWINDKQCISSQKERFSKYSLAQQNRILELENKLKRTFIIEFSDTIDVLKFCKYLLSKYPNIEIAEPYYVAEQCAIPDDPKIGEQTMLSTIQAFEGWDISEGDATVVIGISDSGVNILHEDMRGGVAFNENEIPNNQIDDDNNGYVDDYNGYNFSWLADGGEHLYGTVSNSGFSHGTEVAGMCAARTNNGKGIAGVAYKCKILPIKICSNNNGNYLYGYQSIIYAAVRGCNVLNCSWGTANAYSVINQSIIDYATECDVAVVAAAGNLGSSITDPYTTFYPANYFGVLGVGAVSANDNYTSSYIIGPAMRALAPGENNISIKNVNQYITTTSGSSYAAPVAAGIVGILRSYRPELSPIQALEIVRMSGDDIKGANNGNKFLTNRVNMLQALQFDYTQSPAIILKNKYYENTKNEKTERFFTGDTAVLVLNLVNVLADANDVKVSLENLFILDENSYTLLDTHNTISSFTSQTDQTVKFRFIVNNPANIRRTYYLVNLTSDNYTDNFKINFSIYNNLTTFENKNLIVSISDIGVLGANKITNNEIYGYEFEHKKLGNFLYEGGIVAAAEYQKAISSCTDIQQTSDYNSFIALKELYGENPNTNIIVDDATAPNNKIGVEITSIYDFPTDTSSALRIQLSAKNISGKKINDFVLGHYYDWDINNPFYNESGYFPEAIPESIGSNYATAEYITDEHQSVYVGSLVYLDKEKYNDLNVIPQAIATETELFTNYSNQALLMTSGITHQKPGQGDRQYIVGLHLTDEFLPDTDFGCTICTGVAKTKTELANILQDCILSSVNIITTDKQDKVNMFKDNNKLFIEFYEIGQYNIEVYNLLGDKIISIKTSEAIEIDLYKYSKGLYFITIANPSGMFYFNKFIK